MIGITSSNFFIILPISFIGAKLGINPTKANLLLVDHFPDYSKMVLELVTKEQVNSTIGLQM